MKSLLLTHFTILFFGLLSCKTQVKNDTATIDLKKTSSFFKDIPLNKDGSPIETDKDRHYSDSLLRYPPLDSGYNGLYIRITCVYVFSDSGQIINIKKSQDSYYADLTTIKYIFNKNHDSVIAIKKMVIEKQPTSNWEVFMHQLYELQITTLPDFRKIERYPEFMDGNGVSIQIAKNKEYRLYQYKEPNEAANTFWQAKNIEQILKLVEKELKFSRLRAF